MIRARRNWEYLHGREACLPGENLITVSKREGNNQRRNGAVGRGGAGGGSYLVLEEFIGSNFIS